MTKKRKEMFIFFLFSILVLQGQVEVCAVLPDSQYVQEKAEYYVLLKGSSIHHVITAQRKEESHLLSFIIPGRSCIPIKNNHQSKPLMSAASSGITFHENELKVLDEKNAHAILGMIYLSALFIHSWFTLTFMQNIYCDFPSRFVHVVELSSYHMRFIKTAGFQCF